jgi:hypothetical protein
MDNLLLFYVIACEAYHPQAGISTWNQATGYSIKQLVFLHNQRRAGRLTGQKGKRQ